MQIARRDFVNGVSMSSGAAFLNLRITYSAGNNHNKVGSSWYGYGGLGDYASSQI